MSRPARWRVDISRSFSQRSRAGRCLAWLKSCSFRLIYSPLLHGCYRHPLRYVLTFGSVAARPPSGFLRLSSPRDDRGSFVRTSHKMKARSAAGGRASKRSSTAVLSRLPPCRHPGCRTRRTPTARATQKPHLGAIPLRLLRGIGLDLVAAQLAPNNPARPRPTRRPWPIRHSQP